MAIILYVEDEEDDVYFMRRAFNRSRFKHELRTVADGQAAIDYLSGRGSFADRRQYPFPQLVLLDLNLPMVSGFRVLEWIRHQPGLTGLPVVIFSSSARVEDKRMAQENGANEYIEKPGSGLEFGAVVEALALKWLENPAGATSLTGQDAESGPRRLLGRVGL